LGPYEIHPENPILTSRDDESLELQKAGHGDLVETQYGEWYMVHLCGRPITPYRRCVMGRETAIQKVVWKNDDWIYLSDSNSKPSIKVESPHFAEFKIPETMAKDEFEKDELDINFQTLRVPLGENAMSLKERKGFLRLMGRESLSSLHFQSLVTRRQQSFCYMAETVLEFDPGPTRHMAGLVVYYNTENYYYLCISFNTYTGKNLRVITCNKNEMAELTGVGISIEGAGRVGLRIEVNGEKGQFYYSLDEIIWMEIGNQLDMSKLSDDFIGGKAFTGTFIGMCCQDLSGDGIYADFDYFKYREV
jgi:xylan 1,4-beta-xylosidase